jgi:hypothetical protein
MSVDRRGKVIQQIPWHDMAENDTLTSRKRRTIAALLQARSVEDAAQLAHVAKRTLFRWLGEPSFIAELRQAEGDVISEAARALIADLKANHDTLRTIRDDQSQSASIRLRAAIALDDALLRWRELQNVEQRLAVLEETVYGDKFR